MQGDSSVTSSEAQHLFPPAMGSERAYQTLARAIQKPQPRLGLPSSQHMGQPGIGEWPEQWGSSAPGGSTITMC